jgi:hypothetical protein
MARSMRAAPWRASKQASWISDETQVGKRPVFGGRTKPYELRLRTATPMSSASIGTRRPVARPKDDGPVALAPKRHGSIPVPQLSEVDAHGYQGVLSASQSGYLRVRA